MALSGQTGGWVAVGFEFTVWMKDADITAGTVVDGNAALQDQHSTDNHGPHPIDKDLGCTDDIIEFVGKKKTTEQS